MPSDEDIAVVRDFVDETIATYRYIVVHARGLADDEGIVLQEALREFEDQQHPARIVEQYTRLRDDQVVDAGLYGQQLRQKHELSRLAARDLVEPDPPTLAPLRRRLTRLARRWIKRVKVLVTSLKGLIPGAEALIELLDLLDSALDAR